MTSADRERVVAKHFRADRLGRADNLAFHREAADERRVEALEQVDVLRFLAREVEQGTNAPIVVHQMRPRMVEQERQDEFLHDCRRWADIGARAIWFSDALFESVQACRARPCGPGCRA